MSLADQMLYYISSLSVLIFTIFLFIRGVNLIQRIEEQKWREHFKKSIEAIGKVMSPSRELIHE